LPRGERAIRAGCFAAFFLVEVRFVPRDAADVFLDDPFPFVRLLVAIGSGLRVRRHAGVMTLGGP
jgi:hypothetical protein